VDFVEQGGFLLIIHIGFRKFWWISWISIFRLTVQTRHPLVEQIMDVYILGISLEHTDALPLSIYTLH